MSHAEPRRMRADFFVIGSNSFSGAHFVRHLLERGYRVFGVSRSPEPHSVFLPYRWLDEGQERFRFEQADLNHDLDRLMALVHEARPAHIVNFAAQGMVTQSWDAPEQWYRTNVVAHAALLQRLRAVDFLEKYVQVSTPEVYGATEGWVRESFRYAPSTPYAVSKAACDMHLSCLHKTYDFPVVFTRAANVYGPGQQLYRIVPRTALYAFTGRTLSLHGGGRAVRSFIHIQDVADATERIALRGTPGEAYHIAPRTSVSIRELVETVCGMAGAVFEDMVEITPGEPGRDQAYLLNTDKLRDELGWRDSVGLEDGVRATVAWAKANRETLEQFPFDYVHKP